MATRQSETRVKVPSYLTHFVGREPELAELHRFLESRSRCGETEGRVVTPRPRLLTLCGPGGSGKTRLASELSHAVSRAATAERAAVEAVYWVGLGSLHDASQLARAVAAACGSLTTKSLIILFLRRSLPKRFFYSTGFVC